MLVGATDGGMSGHNTSGEYAGPRTARLLSRIGLSVPLQIQTLRKPTPAESTCSLPSDHDKAQALLVEQRVTRPGYKPPKDQIWSKLSKRRRRAQSELDNWTFTNHEVASVLNRLLNKPTSCSAGVAEAVLLKANSLQVHDLWHHLANKSHNSRTARVLTSVGIRKPRPSSFHELPWLNIATEQQADDHVRVLCQSNLSQEVLGQAMHIAILRPSLDILRTLLSHGANATEHKCSIRKRLRLDDLELAQLLLSAPTPMTTEAWQYCLAPHTGISPAMLSLCVSHRPDIISEHMLMGALELQDLAASTVILAHANPSDVAEYDHEKACRLVCVMHNPELRLGFFALFSDCQCITNSLLLQEQLMKEAKLRHYSIVRTLAESGVFVDCDSRNVLNWAATNVNLDILETLEAGTLSTTSSITSALRCVPDTISEPALLRVLDVLAHIGRTSFFGDALNSRLVPAVEKQHAAAVDRLLSLHADVSASAVQAAIKVLNFGILDALLASHYSANMLRLAIPTAMDVTSRADRLRVFAILLHKGMPTDGLGIQLERLISEDDELDYDLIELFMQHKASSDCSESKTTNSILVATSKGDLRALKLLCVVSPRVTTLSRAVPIAFDRITSSNYNVTMRILHLLLSKGASGSEVNETLLAAADQDPRLDVVRLLLAHGADADFKEGALFLMAVRRNDLELLKFICARCMPKYKTTRRALLAAIHPHHYDRPILDLLLKVARDGAFNSASNFVWGALVTTGILQSHPDSTGIVARLLCHDLDVNLFNGEALHFAVKQEDAVLLRAMLLNGPCSTALERAFDSVASVKNRHIRLALMQLLLENAGSIEIGQSRLLVQETEFAIHGDDKGLVLLLDHGASVDVDEGASLVKAVTAGSQKVFHMLLEYNPSLDSLQHACLATAVSIQLTAQQKHEIYQAIINAMCSELGNDLTPLLERCIQDVPKHVSLHMLLLKRGAKVTATMLDLAIARSPRKVLMLIIEGVSSTEAFQCTRKAQLPLTRRAWIFKLILEMEDHNLSKADLSGALLDVLSDSSKPEAIATISLLLEHGAEVGWKSARSVKLAIEAQSLEAVTLLSQHIETSNVGDVALWHLTNGVVDDSRTRIQMYDRLLARNVSKAACSSTLVTCLAKNEPQLEILDLLLRRGAEVNDNCFILACKTGNVVNFGALCRYTKQLDVVVETILNHCESESKAVAWYQVCSEKFPGNPTLKDQRLLLSCLRKFPEGVTFLLLLLANGISTQAMVPYTICQGSKEEQCTILIWALFVKPKVANNTIMALVKRDYVAANLGYCTPSTQVSAAFVCLLDSTRLPILKALLAQHRSEVLDYMVPGPTLAYFAAHGDVEDWDDIGPQTLAMAAFLIGNFDAFRLLNDTTSDQEGLLHLAALLALPKFVKALLHTHDPNMSLEEYENAIPLAIAMQSTPHPWCRVANKELNFEERRIQTIKHLTPETDLDWRDRGKNVFHLALEQGPGTATAFLEALDLEENPEKREKLVYTDKEDREYRPHEYVTELMDLNQEDQEKLLACLREAGLVFPS